MALQAQGCMLPMGVTSENVAAKYGISRQQQDEFAVRSHRKAAAAQAAGKFKDEIVPVKTKVRVRVCVCGGGCCRGAPKATLRLLASACGTHGRAHE